MEEWRREESRLPDKPKEYHDRHRAVVKSRGKAKEHPCADCDNPAESWSQIHGKDGSSIEHYEPRCWPCHHKYDDRWNEEERKKVANGVSRYHASLSSEERAERGRRISAGKIGKKRPPATEQARANMKAGQRARRERERGGSTV